MKQYEVGTLAVDGWAVTFGTARRGLGGAPARPGPLNYVFILLVFNLYCLVNIQQHCHNSSHCD